MNSHLSPRRGIDTWSEENSHELNAPDNRSNGRGISSDRQAPRVVLGRSKQPLSERVSRRAAVLQSLCRQAKQRILWRRLLLLRRFPQIRVTLLTSQVSWVQALYPRIRAGPAFGGGSGIRTHDTVSRIHAFQASALSHSAIPPQAVRGAGTIAKAGFVTRRRRRALRAAVSGHHACA
jgi:hypothetical protein